MFLSVSVSELGVCVSSIASLGPVVEEVPVPRPLLMATPHLDYAPLCGLGPQILQLTQIVQSLGLTKGDRRVFSTSSS